jgi:hypothetical protein
MLNNQILRYWQAKNNDIDQLLLNASIHYLPILFSTIQYEMGCVDKPTGKGTVKTCSFWDMLRTCFIPSYQLLHVFFFPLSTYSHGRPCAYTHTHLHFTHRFIWRVPTMGVTSRPKQTKGPKKNKSSMSIGFSIINHPATGVPPFFWKPSMYLCVPPWHQHLEPYEVSELRLHVAKTAVKGAHTQALVSPHWSASLPWNLVPFKNGEASLVEDESINSNCGRYFMSDLHRFKIFPLVN